MGLRSWIEYFKHEKRMNKLARTMEITPIGYRLRQYCRNIINNDEYDIIPEFEDMLAQTMHENGCDRCVAARVYLEIFDEISERMYG